MEPIVKKVVSQGNALAVIIPRGIMRAKNIKLGDYVRIDEITKVELIVKDVK